MTRAVQVTECQSCPLITFGQGDALFCEHPDAPDTPIESCVAPVPSWCPLHSEPLWLELASKRGAFCECKGERHVLEIGRDRCLSCARPFKREVKLDPLHPTGRCTCHGEGTCEWCVLICPACGGDPRPNGCASCNDSGWRHGHAPDPPLGVVEPEAAATETVLMHRDVEGTTGAKGSEPDDTEREP